MSEETLIPEGFFANRLSVKAALEILEPIIGRPDVRDALIRELVAVARRTHPGSLRMIAAMEATVDALSEDERAQAGFLTVAMVQCCDQSQRYAAVRALGRFLPDEDAFQVLWSEAIDPKSNTRNEAMRALADNLPHHAVELLAAYRAPYKMIPAGGVPDRFIPNLRPKIAATIALILGIGQCEPGLQEEIRRTVRFRYDGPAENESKHANHPDCHVRNEALIILSVPFETNGRGDSALAERIRAAIGEHFLEDFLQVFVDRGWIGTEAVRIAMAWRQNKRVIDALAENLEIWGGTRQSHDVTKSIILAHANSVDALVTERFLRAVNLVEGKPMDAPWEGMEDGARPPWTFIGEWSANEIRVAIARWRTARAADIAALSTPLRAPDGLV